jgi:hypothetical protein
LKGVTLTVGVKIGKKRVLLENFQQDLSIEYRLKQASEGRLADSNDPFDGNIHGWAPVVKSRCAGWRP